jgi:hypothetical protein
MPIVIFMGRNVKEYLEICEIIIRQCIVEGRFLCAQCLHPMRRHSSYKRGIKETKERIRITVVWCSRCREFHAVLPDFLLPYKHYSGNEVESAIIDSATEPVERIDTEASESTVRRWIEQVGGRIRRAVGVLKILFGRAGHAVSEAAIDPGPAYSELEQILEMAPSAIKCSGNKLGLANMWLGTGAMPIFI